jgi:drug/metabolite transporter superfamily protein YnfA
VNLATAPVFVCLSAYALGTLADTSRFGRVLAAVGAVLVASDGARMCLVCLGLPPAF